MSALGSVPAPVLMPLRVTDVRQVALGIRSIELRHPAGNDLPPFEAGSHIQVEMLLPDGSSALRHYSLLGDAGDPARYRIAVLLEPGGRGGSRYIHEELGIGSTLPVSPPEQGFPLLDADHSILIAGGIGITPILSMIRELERRRASYEVHYVARTPDHMAFREEVRTLAGSRAHLYFDQVEHPTPLQLERVLAPPRPGGRVYVCGPPMMIRAVRSLGEAAGWPERSIHFESFGSTRRADDRPLEVRLERSGLRLSVSADESILDAMLNAGVWTAYECRRGQCGSCVVRVIDGRPDHRDACLTEQVRQDHMCPCVSRAHSDSLTLDL